MSLSPILSAAKRPRHIVYDLEWYPETMRLRLAGVYDGDRYQSFEGIPALMRCLLARENRGTWIFAHFGGAADIAFIMQWFTEHDEYTVEMMFSGSSAVIIEVKRGKDVWLLVDSYFLMRDKLENIGRAIGMAKGTEGQTAEEKYAMFHAPLPILRDYNEQDCRILWHAIDKFCTEIMSLGGELRPTIASCAMTLFRRRFLKCDMRTSDSLNDTFRPAYIASRVEVYRRRLEGEANKYDINSSFPASMAEPCPGSAIGFNTALPKNHDCFMAEVDIAVKAGTYLPPLPYRVDGRVFFPTGSWRAVLSGPDVRFAEEHGALVKVHTVWTFQQRTDLRDYVQVIYGMRKNETDEFRRLLLKYLLNSLYGKFGEGAEKQKVVINPPASMHNIEGAHMIRPGVWAVSTFKHANHEHVALAAHITANSRRRISRYLMQAGDAYYCDTDSIITKQTLPHSKELGHLKRENPVTAGYFAAPKFYYIREKGEAGSFDTVKAKGFPKLDKEGFDKLVAGGSHPLNRMARPKEMWRDGNLNPRTYDIQKAARLTLDKRRFDASGESQPYTLEELARVIRQVPEQASIRFPRRF